MDDDQVANQDSSNTRKDPQEWTTGDEPMTGAQASYLQTLCKETGTEFNPDWTKAEASEKIEQLQNKNQRLQKDG